MSRTLFPDLSRSARLTSLCLAGGLVVGGLCATELLAQQNRQGQQGEQTAGEATVRERSGPSVEAQAGQQPRVIVLFPKASDSASASNRGQQSSGDIRIICLDRPSQQQSGQQGQQNQQRGQQGQEQEIVFSSDNAMNGLVSYDFGGQRRGASQGQGRSLSFIAESGGQRLNVEQAVQRDNVIVLTVKRDPQEQQRQQQAQNQRNQQQASGRGQAQVGGAQANQGEASAAGVTEDTAPQAQTAADQQGQQGQAQQGQQSGGQQAQGQQGQGGGQQQQQEDLTEAVIFVYLSPAQQ